jgi:carboxyl-terminal processing protease
MTRSTKNILVTVAALSAFMLMTAMVEDSVQRMLRGHELLSAIYQTILSEYVEEVAPDDLFQSGVKGMLGHLDPYAELIEERENSEVDVLARGVYNGLGIKVQRRDGHHFVSYIYDEVRSLTNLRLGDEILRVDSVDLRRTDLTDLRDLLRGQAGTAVNLLVRRPGLSDSLEMQVLRRTISIDPLPIHDVSKDGILYMKLTRFSRSAVDSVTQLLGRAYREKRIQGIVIDVRDNPGGLLEAAVAIVDNFVAPGTPIVSMKGRQSAYARKYSAKTEALDANVPIAVLVNGQSASAAEILAGSLQDLDRALILGQRSYGKGLVQTLLPLNYNAWLKLTTSKYYMPSGRCIQRFAYAGGKQSRLNADDKDGPVFSTLKLSRPVRESNGIVPDLILEKDSLSPLLSCLERHDAYFTFVSLYVNRQAPKTVPTIGRDLRAAFKHYADSIAGCEGNTLTEALRSLRIEAKRQNMDDIGLRSVEDVDAGIRRLRSTQFDTEWAVIKERLEEEFIFHLDGDHARLRLRFSKDHTVRRAVTLLRDAEAFEAALRGHGTD